jgi:hypothetical protein
MKVCMLSSVHSADDVRIAGKKNSLSKRRRHAVQGKVPVAVRSAYNCEHDAAGRKNLYSEAFLQRANA